MADASNITPVTLSQRGAPVTPAIDPAVQYRVELLAPIDLFGKRVYPGHSCILRGDILLAVKDKVADAKPV
jgi:hypothetical protein